MRKEVRKMAAEMMGKAMNEAELDQVVGGAKVFIIAHRKNGKTDVLYGDFQGDMNSLQTLAKGGKVNKLAVHFSRGHMRGVPGDYLKELIARYKGRGYKIMESYEK